MEKVKNFLLKLLPEEDKLRHSFIATSAFALLSAFAVLCGISTPFIIPYLIVFLGTIVWEGFQKYYGGTNSFKEILKDIFWSNILNTAILAVILLA